MRNKQHQQEVLWQMNEKQETRRERLMREMDEERNRRLLELNFDRRIREEEARGRQLIADAKRGRMF